MTRDRSYILTKNQLSRYQKRLGSVVTCSRCGEPLSIGQEVERKINSKKVYHKKCLDSMYFEEESR